MPEWALNPGSVGQRPPLVLNFLFRYHGIMKPRRARLVLPIIIMIIFALSRWPGVMPPNFSAAYGLAFCAGVYFSRPMAWTLPLTTLFVSDLLINGLYYQIDLMNVFMLANYIAYAAIVWLGQRFGPGASWCCLLSGGLFSAILFYLITNTASWIFDPAYSKTLGGWMQSLTIGTPGWPHTWEFFRNTLLSGGLFAGLFAGAMKFEELLECPEADDIQPTPEAGEPEESPA